MLSPPSLLWNCFWTMANACWQDNTETRAAAKEFHCSHPFISGGKAANKGLLCDSIWMFTTCRSNEWHIFRSAHPLEWRLTIPSNPTDPSSSFLFALAAVKQATSFLPLFYFQVWCGGWHFLAKAPRVLNLRPIWVETLEGPCISFGSRLHNIPMVFASQLYPVFFLYFFFWCPL